MKIERLALPVLPVARDALVLSGWQKKSAMDADFFRGAAEVTSCISVQTPSGMSLQRVFFLILKGISGQGLRYFSLKNTQNESYL